MSIAEAVTGALLGLGSTAFSWGLGNKSSNRYKSSVRHLRRREYQDMMFSMKAAGLNPILASGATPGHMAGAMSNVPATDLAGSAQDVASTMELGARKEKTQSETLPKDLVQQQAQQDLWNTAAQYDVMSSQALAARESAKLSGEQATTEAIKRAKMEAEQGLIGASAQEIRTRTAQLELDNKLRQIDVDFAGTPEGQIMRNYGLTGSDLGSLAGGVLKGANSAYSWGRGALKGLQKEMPGTAKRVESRVDRAVSEAWNPKTLEEWRRKWSQKQPATANRR